MVQCVQVVEELLLAVLQCLRTRVDTIGAFLIPGVEMASVRFLRTFFLKILKIFLLVKSSAMEIVKDTYAQLLLRIDKLFLLSFDSGQK